MDIYDAIKGLGFLGFMLLIMFLVLLPTICTIIIGIWLAGVLHLTGITWWAFIILLTIITLNIITALSKE